MANGDCALDICFASPPSEDLSRCIIGIRQSIQKQDFPGLVDLIPAYQCLTITFDPLTCDRRLLTQQLIELAQGVIESPPRLNRKPRTISIPVCYEEVFAPDMHTVSEYTKLSREEIIALHTHPPYLVHMLGFSPGFLYLGGLDPQLHCPRKHTPRLRISAGAVGIGGSQTGVYPQATPGGWQIIGQTPIGLFHPARDTPCIAEPLDTVKFHPVDITQFEAIRQSYPRAKYREKR
ncbi:5-oxoprolinase subunit PxpB [uncultured Microbulbifer sp.]|uniref:5-oxoprolinase subunit PxpB n=1 Tax=uncultured Microbulbifer sp. TaxID=348147 RepID=UPI0026266C82|nr:5-oxoprolinase subunit PxpB [uncultured Microbulbifer sp.]